MRRQEAGRPDSADLAVVGCGWILITGVVALPGILSKDGPLTTFMAVLGMVIGSLWARQRLRR